MQSEKVVATVAVCRMLYVVCANKCYSTNFIFASKRSYDDVAAFGGAMCTVHYALQPQKTTKI